MSIRVRLTLLYTAVMAVVLLLFGIVLYAAVEAYLSREIDALLAEMAEHVAGSLSAAAGPVEAAPPDLDPYSAPGAHVQVLDRSGLAIAHSAGLGIHDLPYNYGSIAEALGGRPSYYTASVEAERIRVYSLPVQSPAGLEGVVQVGKSYHDYDFTLAQLQRLLLVGTGLALLVAGTASWAVASRALRPVADIAASARAIGHSRDFGQRLSVPGAGGELGVLAAAFNEMLASLEEAYASQRRFVADASHELRAPLTAIRGNIEFVQRSPDLPAELRKEALSDALAETERLTRLASELLSLARADAGRQWSRRPVALGSLARDLWEGARHRAPELILGLGTVHEVTVWGDADRLKQVGLILLDNAIKYTPPGGRIEVSLKKGDGEARLSIADTGVGIEPQDLPHVFERFFRADKARARDSGGSGLGLAIAAAIVERHGGRIEVESVPGAGSTFTVRLPLLS